MLTKLAKRRLKPHRNCDTLEKTQRGDDKACSFQVQKMRDIKDVLACVREINEKLDNINSFVSGGSSQNASVGSCDVPSVKDKIFGLEVPLKEVKVRLLDDRVDLLVVSGPGGSGKTTLAKMLCNDPQVQDRFKENVSFVTFGKTPNIKAIIRGIFEQKRNEVPRFSSDEHAIIELENLLKKIGPNATLLVLDDVWPLANNILEKFRFRIPGCKILLTSRFVFPQFCRTYRLKPLNDEDAMSLFSQAAFPTGKHSMVPDEDVVKKIVRGCKGLPLALEVFGRYLRGRPVESWQSLLMKLSEGYSILKFNNTLLGCLKSSLDLLDLEKKYNAKECLMDLASFPEDQRIPATALIDMWVELYELDENGKNAIDNIKELANRNLVELIITREDASHFEGCYSEHFVSQHDLLRELSLHQSSLVPVELRERLFIEISENSLPSWCMELQQQTINARLLSITTDKTFAPNWCDMEVPEVKVLVLNFRTGIVTLPQFMKKMNNLKVLIITNCGNSDGELNNFELPCSLPNLKRIRLEHISIPPLTKSTSQLKNLEKISLDMCKIGQGFSRSTFKISDTLPNLLEISIDNCDDLRKPPDELCDVLCLKKLSITNCHRLTALPERIGNLVNIDELRLYSCTGLLELPCSIGKLQSLSFLDISNCLSIRKLPEQIGCLSKLKKLHMRRCLGLWELPESIINLGQLVRVICDEETALLWEYVKPYLRHLNVEVAQEEINLNWLHGVSS